MKHSELQTAKKLVMRALAEGARPEINGEWVEWRDRMPSPDLLFEMATINRDTLKMAIKLYTE